MNLTVMKASSEPGFRLSVSDLVLFLCSIGASWALAHDETMSALAPLPLHVFLTFFAFCNVFRVAQKQEMVFAAVFALGLLLTVGAGREPYPFALWLGIPAAFVAIVWSAVSNGYRGFGHQWLSRVPARFGPPFDA